MFPCSTQSEGSAEGKRESEYEQRAHNKVFRECSFLCLEKSLS